jgi:hypothetical protein
MAFSREPLSASTRLSRWAGPVFSDGRPATGGHRYFRLRFVLVLTSQPCRRTSARPWCACEIGLSSLKTTTYCDPKSQIHNDLRSLARKLYTALDLLLDRLP